VYALVRSLYWNAADFARSNQANEASLLLTATPSPTHFDQQYQQQRTMTTATAKAGASLSLPCYRTFENCDSKFFRKQCDRKTSSAILQETCDSKTSSANSSGTM
jgi:hypothetical protein